MIKIILASTSKGRQKVMIDAGIRIDNMIDAGVDENIVKESLTDVREIAIELACQKSVAVSEKYSDALVIGGDQTLSLINSNNEVEILNSPKTVEGVSTRITKLSGLTHTLHSGLAVAKGGKVIFSGVFDAHMSVRKLSPEFIDWYVNECGDKVKKSVGGYHFEGLGAQIFEKIDGDYFTILGLPLIPLTTFLKQQGILK